MAITTGIFHFVGAVGRRKLELEVQAFTGAKRVRWVGGFIGPRGECNVVKASVTFDNYSMDFLNNLTYQAQIRGYFMVLGQDVALKVAEAYLADPKAGFMEAYETVTYGKLVK